MTRGQMAFRIFTKGLGMTQTRRRRVVAQTIAQAEGGDALNNMWNSTENWPGATDYNSARVKNYPSEDAGVAATVKTFESSGHGYGKILTLLREDAPARQVVIAWGESDWGTASKLALEVWAMIMHVPGMLRLLERKQVAS